MDLLVIPTEPEDGSSAVRFEFSWLPQPGTLLVVQKRAEHEEIYSDEVRMVIPPRILGALMAWLTRVRS